VTIHKLLKHFKFCICPFILSKPIVMPYITDGPGSSISFNPVDQSITKVLGQSLGPIICSAQCNPPCQFYWITPDGSVVAGSNLTIPSLSKNDHGTFTCHSGNGYGNNATKKLSVAVNCKYMYMIIYFDLMGPGGSVSFWIT
jgi:hypothetical protein